MDDDRTGGEPTTADDEARERGREPESPREPAREATRESSPSQPSVDAIGARAGAALASLERHLLLAVDRMSDGFVALDRDWRYVYVNASAGALFGRDPASLVGRHIWTEFPNGVGQPFHLAYERAMATQEPQQFEEYYAPWNRWFENRLYPSPDGLSILFTEVTERKLAEQALREGDARYRLVAGAGSTMLFEWDVATGRVWREGGLLASLGYGPEANRESLDWWMARIHPDDLPASDARRRTQSAGESETDEQSIGYRFRRRDGGYVTLAGRSRLLRHPDGRAKSVVGVITDATDRRSIEDALRVSEARFRAFVEQASDAVIVLDAEATFRYVGPSVTRILGHDPAALVGRNAFDYVHAEDVMAAAETFARGLAEPGTPKRVELRALDADGSWRPMEAVGRALDGTNDVLVHLRDVGERHDAERAMRDSEERFRALATHAPVGVFQSDLEGHITYVNPRIAQIFDIPAEEGMGYGWVVRLHPEDRDAVLADWTGKLATGTDFQREFRLLLPDGSVRWVEGRSAPLHDASGALVGSVGTVEDHTQRRRLEQQLLHSQKLEAVGQLSGGVAHDFNNLLTVIQANVELARGAANAEVRADLDEIAAAAARAAQLTRQLLAFSRRQVLQPTLLDLNAVVADAERLLRRLLGERIQVESVLAPDLWRVRADAGQMEQVLMNLAVNARDAMSASGGTLTIETANVPATPGDPESRDCVRLRVRDTGAGMPADVRDRAFEPFFTTKAPGVGTGLGLSMVYGIVTQSEGTVQVESAPGEGATFNVTLPRVSEAAAAGAGGVASEPTPSPTGPGGGASGGGERILLVEDESAVRGVARRILERAGYVVLEARHGADALLVWRESGGGVDLLLTDVRMPELGGLELVARLREQRPSLPAVVMSGYADAGAPGSGEWFLEKPFSRDALLRVVRRALDGETPGTA